MGSINCVRKSEGRKGRPSEAQDLMKRIEELEKENRELRSKLESLERWKEAEWYL